jgi:light-regulated signal transduction histidine kinase (bacteriophytochrome)
MELVRKNEQHSTAEVRDAQDARQIAHGFNNVLAVIGGHTEILMEALPADSPLRHSLAAIQQSTAQAATLTRKLFQLSRRQQTATELFDPSRVFRNVEAEARHKFGRRIAVGVELAEPLWLVHADAGRMQLAISTVTAYAIDAMPYGGSITLRGSNAEVRPHDPGVHAFVKEGRYVRFDVVCSRTLAMHERLDDFAPLHERAARDGVDLARIFSAIKRSGGYLWIGTDEATSETALTMLWPTEPATAAPTTGGWRAHQRAAESY